VSYHVVSLGQQVELLEWKTSINPSATIGIYWLEDTLAFDLWIGHLCIRFKNDRVEVSIPDRVLAVANIRGDTFTKNPLVQDILSQPPLTYMPLVYVTNVTVSLDTHNIGEFALSNSIEREEVTLRTLGKTLDLGISYHVLYGHMTPKIGMFPSVFTAIQIHGASNARFEKRFLGPSNFWTRIPSPSVDANSDDTFSALAYLTACFDAFGSCKEVKTQITSWAVGAKPFEMQGVGSTRRRLLQEESHLDAYLIRLNDTSFNLHSVTSTLNTATMNDFRLTTRLRIQETADTTPGLILSNRDPDYLPGPGYDMVITLVADDKLRMSICGVEYVSEYSLEPEVWHEVAFAVKTGSIVSILHNNQAVVSTRLEDTHLCTINNAFIDVGSSLAINGSQSAVGVEVQYVLLNSDIRVMDTSVFLDGTFSTNDPDLHSSMFEAVVMEKLEHKLALYIQGVYGRGVHLSTFSEQVDANIVIYARVYFQNTAVETIHSKVSGFTTLMNTELTYLNLPTLHLIDNAGDQLSETVVPFLELTYQRTTPLYCDLVLGELSLYQAICMYNDIEDLNAHSITFNYRQIGCTDTGEYKEISNDFSTFYEFKLKSSDLEMERTAAMASTFDGFWCIASDCSIEFFIRTGFDDTGRLMTLTINIPTDKPITIRIEEPTKGAGYVELKVRLGTFGSVLSTQLTTSRGFQHIRVVFLASGAVSLWVDGLMKRSIKSKRFSIKYGDIIFYSNPLFFGDGIRELSSIHLSTATADVCECKSACPFDTYGEHCLPCPNNTFTLYNGSTNLNQCVCDNGFHRPLPDPLAWGGSPPQEDCVPDEYVPFTEYNASLNIKAGFCSKSNGAGTLTDDMCVKPLESHGCRCDDDCFFAQEGEQQCCNNKCSVCPNSQACQCVWDWQAQMSVNTAIEGNDAYCEGYVCGPGQRVHMGKCTPCEKGSWKDKVSTESVCADCEVCEGNNYRSDCGGSDGGRCVACTPHCEPGFIKVHDCTIDTDTECVNQSTCEGIGFEILNCSDGTYHAGCDLEKSEQGWCELCPIQEATQCSPGFFLNFLCKGGALLSPVPNECLPCNRALCPLPGFFPTKTECGVQSDPHTMIASDIKCGTRCTDTSGAVYIERVCQYVTASAYQDTWVN
jgi:hypothetical protein